ncbi:hypothetical protein [Leifsonia sp. 2MCAF36]|uniref:hypothetical protein n=1 Tax=Leifsonia sp. 2MCAF36 TaxID=3232988 RepID=UPI003F989FE5
MSTPPGWFPNPQNSDEEVYWDGDKWTGDARPVYGVVPQERSEVSGDEAPAETEDAPSEVADPAEGVEASGVTDVPEGTARKKRSVLWMSLAVVVALLVAGGVTAAVVANNVHMQEVAQEKAAAKKKADDRAAAAAEAARAAKVAAAAKQAADDAKRAQRVQTITTVEAAIKKMAEDDIAKGLLTGPVLGVSCNPVSGSADDLTDTTTTFDCFVGNKDNGDGTQSGYFFNATINWTSGEYTYGLGKSGG